MKTFDIGNWHGKLLFTPGYYEELYSYVKNEDARQEYSKSISVYNAEGDKTSLFNYENETIKQTYLQQLDRAMLDYSNMMILTLSSYIEIIIQDFFESFFDSQPETMYEYLPNLNNDKMKGYVDLETILNTNNYDELKSILSVRAATNANKGTFKSIMKRLEKLSKHEFNETLIVELDNLVHRRNKIVHEDRTFEIDQTIIKNVVENVLNLLRELGKICKSKNIPLYDGGGLLP
ncbi:MAG: HEPN domain-containing protein [Ignavibacteria bacterium]|nr:HEPN domain-containing protein [Ignavibacteria bacterium]MDP3831511.1 HEPN domain-containing protein [Ignavibacteriaceae bacterium]